MRTIGIFSGTERLIDLERTVNSLNGQLRKMQGDLCRVKAEPFSSRLWRNLVNLKGRQEFMSTVCNQDARPNTKMISYADPRA